MKLIRLMETITVVLSSGEIISSSTCDDAMFNDIYKHQGDEDYVRNLLLPEFNTKRKEAEQKKALFSGLSDSKYLSTKGSSVYIESISQLSLPEDLVKAILKAESEGDEDLIQVYLNFWTLTSLNPDSRCRQNLFWFLNKYGMTISKSGLFVGYRNVSVKKQGANFDTELAKFISSEYARIKFVSKKSPKNFSVYKVDKDSAYYVRSASVKDEGIWVGNLQELYKELSNVEVAPVYTDHYTRKFEIKLGEIVSMPRNKCDSVQENSCSRGLHVAGKSWLTSNYFGDTALMVLVNPADVVAVPPIDDYGKMRTCAYYPVSIVEFDECGRIIDLGIEDGFEDDFIEKICYSGQVNNYDPNPYNVTIPDIPELDKAKINSRLLDIAKSMNKVI